MTRDGFAVLAMGFTGPKALAFKLAYIAAFNRMEGQLRLATENSLREALETKAERGSPWPPSWPRHRADLLRCGAERPMARPKIPLSEELCQLSGRRPGSGISPG
jgi:hypothetical protein